MESQQRVAIVGSGLAGLVSAHLLHADRRQRYAVKVFESVSFFSQTYFGWKVVLTL
jgi:predicted NAD/FAD-binding protein